MKELIKKYGRPIKPKELGQFLGLDRRTVVKYAHLWGGVEVAPVITRFFENLVEEVLNANFNKETRKAPLSSKRNGQRRGQTEMVSRSIYKIKEGSSDMGKARKRKNGKGTIPDKFDLFKNLKMVK